MNDIPVSRKQRLQELIANGRDIVARQQELVRQIEERGGDCTNAVERLAEFERSLALFEAKLADIVDGSS
jgi:hypothetical protein